MVCCSAVNCSNRSEKGFRLFRFPTNEERRKKWILNCRRGDWKPTSSSHLCEVHFEENQFEWNRADSWKKLKQNAIPTLFDVPNPPARIGDQIKIDQIAHTNPEPVHTDNIPQMHFEENHFEQNRADNWNELKQTVVPTLFGVHPPATPVEDPTEVEKVGHTKTVPVLLVHESEIALKQKIVELERENKRLKEQIASKDRSLMFLSEEQRKFSGANKNSIHKWSQEGVIQSLKLRIALGKSGYNYLRTTGYPCPSYSTLHRWIRQKHMKLNDIDPTLNDIDLSLNDFETEVECMEDS